MRNQEKVFEEDFVEEFKHNAPILVTTASTSESFKVEHVKYEKGKTENYQGYTYTGEFENGKKHGKCTKIYDQKKGSWRPSSLEFSKIADLKME